jgi:hypothetical protein
MKWVGFGQIELRRYLFLNFFYLFLFSWKYVKKGGKKWDMEKFERWSSWEVINLKNWNLKKNHSLDLSLQKSFESPKERFARALWVLKSHKYFQESS